MSKVIHFNKSPEPFLFEVDVKPLNRRQRLLFQLRPQLRKRVLKMYPLTLSTGVSIVKLFSGIDLRALEADKIILEGPQVIEAHLGTIIKILALAFTNRGAKCSKRLERFIEAQFSNEDLLKAMIVAKKQLHMETFIAALCTLRGIDLFPSTQNQLA